MKGKELKRKTRRMQKEEKKDADAKVSKIRSKWKVELKRKQQKRFIGC